MVLTPFKIRPLIERNENEFVDPEYSAGNENVKKKKKKKAYDVEKIENLILND